MSELDKTIEDLEAEVTAELEEAADAPKKGAVAGEKGSKVEGDTEDLGAPVVKGDEKSGPDAAKKIKKDTSIPTVVKGDEAPQKLKEEDDSDEDEKDSDDEEEKMDEMDDEPKMEMPKTKAGMEQAIMAQMKGMKKPEMENMYAQVMKSSYGKSEESVKKEALDIDSIDVTDDVNALVEGEDLSEEFTAKATTIFEAAVKSKLRSEVERLSVEKTHEVAEEVETFKSELTEKVDSYLDYVVKEWMQENELAIDRGLKGEIAEDFITGLKALFEEHYIDVPDEKYDILGTQSEKIDELEAKLNEQIEKTADLKKSHDVLVRESVFAEVASDLADTEVEKFKSLAEDVEFNNEESFKEKLDTLKESYFPKATTIAESVDTETDGSESYDTTGAMSAYMAAISKNVKRAD